MDKQKEVLRTLKEAINDPQCSWGSLATYLAAFWTENPESQSFQSFVEWLEDYHPDWREKYWDWFYGFPANGDTEDEVAEFIASWFDLTAPQEKREAGRFFETRPLKEWGFFLAWEDIIKKCEYCKEV